jgi:hypothetical protein
MPTRFAPWLYRALWIATLAVMASGAVNSGIMRHWLAWPWIILLAIFCFKRDAKANKKRTDASVGSVKPKPPSTHLGRLGLCAAAMLLISYTQDDNPLIYTMRYATIQSQRDAYLVPARLSSKIPGVESTHTWTSAPVGASQPIDPQEAAEWEKAPIGSSFEACAVTHVNGHYKDDVSLILCQKNTSHHIYIHPNFLYSDFGLDQEHLHSPWSQIVGSGVMWPLLFFTLFKSP